MACEMLKASPSCKTTRITDPDFGVTSAFTKESHMASAKPVEARVMHNFEVPLKHIKSDGFHQYYTASRLLFVPACVSLFAF
jgi:hypothetical protein